MANNHQTKPDHDAAIALIIAGAAPNATPEAELAAAGTILHFELKHGAWMRCCPSCHGTMWLMDTDSDDGIIAVGLGIGRKPCTDVPRVNEWLRDWGFQNSARHRAAVAAMVRQNAGAGVSTHASDLPGVNLLMVRCALLFIPNNGAGVHFDIWFNIGAAIYSAMPDDDGFELWRAWSSRSSKYKENVCRDKWTRDNGFRRITRVTIGTLFYHADQCDRRWRNFYQQQLNNEVQS